MAAIVDQFIVRLESQMDAMREAIADGRDQDVADLAHWLKGSGGNVGFRALGPMAAELEQFAKNNNTEGMSNAMQTIEQYAERIERGRDPAFLNKSA